MTKATDNIIEVHAGGDIVAVRRSLRKAAQSLGFSAMENTRIVTAASELFRNVYKHAGRGLMKWKTLNSGDAVGIEIIFEDHRPGISDLGGKQTGEDLAGGGYGVGVLGARRLMDEMLVRSQPGRGTRFRVVKWRANSISEKETESENG